MEIKMKILKTAYLLLAALSLNFFYGCDYQKEEEKLKWYTLTQYRGGQEVSREHILAHNENTVIKDSNGDGYQLGLGLEVLVKKNDLDSAVVISNLGTKVGKRSKEDKIIK